VKVVFLVKLIEPIEVELAVGYYPYIHIPCDFVFWRFIYI